MTAAPEGANDLIVVANRLPVEAVYENDDLDGIISGWQTAPGGLVSALEPVLRARSSIWVGAGDMRVEELEDFGKTRLEPVSVPNEDYQLFYAGFANTAIWPLYHAGIVSPEFHRDQFDAYERVNKIFADRIVELAENAATIWVHDYQLQLLPGILREQRVDLKIGFFLHIPFPPASLFAQIPWRAEILRGLLGSDLIGFQTHQDTVHFVDACHQILGLHTSQGKILFEGREICAAAFPIGIDAESFATLARHPAVVQRAKDLRSELGNPQTLVLGVDRLDYTKGIDIRLRAFAELLESERLDPTTTVLVQVAIPTRGNILEYQTIRDEVELLVGRFNGSLAQIGANPISYVHRVLAREELVALYVAADIMLVTPLRDGMNLVAKEYVACRTDNSGALVLSEFTGSAAQLTDAWLVNPFDTDGVQQAILDAVDTSEEDRANRMEAMRKVVFESDVTSWANSFIELLVPSTTAPAKIGLSDLSELPLKNLARTHHLLVCCDYDGTLAPLVDDPSKAFPLDEAITILRQISLLPSTTVAVVSGRSRKDLAALSRLPPEIHLVGSHGSEFDANFHLDTQQLRLLDQVITSVNALAAHVKGSHIEVKPGGVAVHVRRSDPADRDLLVNQITMGPGQFPGVHVQYGKDVVELSVVEASKADAVATLRHVTGASAVVFLGDDLTDESVFQALTGPDVGVKVGPGPTSAPWRVADPHEVGQALVTLCDLRQSWLLGGHATPIEDYALLSNMSSVALLSPRGSIDWLCAPDPDSPAVFAALLGDESSGYFSIAPAGDKKLLSQSYQRNELVVRTRWPGLTLTDFMPMANSPEDTRMRIVRQLTGSVPARIEFSPRPNFGNVATTIEIEPEGLRVSAGSECFALYAPGIDWEIREDSGHHTAVAVVDPSKGEFTLEFCYENYDALVFAARKGHDDQALTSEFWTSWASQLLLPGIRPQAEMRSALTLRALCHRKSGGILAAATTSLPEALGGTRNWDYRFVWIRDAALSARELLYVGSITEAVDYLNWLEHVNASVTGVESLRPIYRINGERLGAEASIDSLPGYAGSRPVRVGNAADSQLQIDVFGPVCLLIEQLVQARGSVSEQEWTLTCSMVDAVGRRWMNPDHGIWEIRDRPKHYTHSRMMCWLAVNSSLQIAQRNGTPQPAWETLREEIAAAIESENWSDEVGAYIAAVDFTHADAAVLQGILEGYPAPRERIAGTVSYIESELRREGGVYRYLYSDGLPHGEGAMHICAAWLAGTYARLGINDDALQLLDAILSSAGGTGLLPEQVDPSDGRGLGNHPQAYSHLGVLTVCRHLKSAASEDPKEGLG